MHHLWHEGGGTAETPQKTAKAQTDRALPISPDAASQSAPERRSDLGAMGYEAARQRLSPKDPTMRTTRSGDQRFVPIGKVWNGKRKSAGYQPKPETAEALRRDDPSLEEQPEWVAETLAEINRERNVRIPAEMQRTGLKPNQILQCEQESRAADWNAAAPMLLSDASAHLPALTPGSGELKESADLIQAMSGVTDTGDVQVGDSLPAFTKPSDVAAKLPGRQVYDACIEREQAR